MQHVQVTANIPAAQLVRATAIQIAMDVRDLVWQTVLQDAVLRAEDVELHVLAHVPEDAAKHAKLTVLMTAMVHV